MVELLGKPLGYWARVLVGILLLIIILSIIFGGRGRPPVQVEDVEFEEEIEFQEVEGEIIFEETDEPIIGDFKIRNLKICNVEECPHKVFFRGDDMFFIYKVEGLFGRKEIADVRYYLKKGSRTYYQNTTRVNTTENYMGFINMNYGKGVYDFYIEALGNEPKRAQVMIR